MLPERLDSATAMCCNDSLPRNCDLNQKEGTNKIRESECESEWKKDRNFNSEQLRNRERHQRSAINYSVLPSSMTRENLVRYVWCDIDMI